MVRHLFSGGIAISLVALVLAVFMSPGRSMAQKKGGSMMDSAQYLVISRHTPEQCLQALDDISAEGSDVLAKFEWGCMAGDHTGYALVQAGSEAEALNIVPASIRSEARAIKVVKFTPEQIKAFHEKM
jgi:hypothetical protein